MMKAADFAAACKRTATNYKTAYMLGTFGWPATAANISRAIKSNGTNAVRPVWQSKAYGIQDKGFLFDCVGLIKGILWGWNGSLTATYGGGKYASNGVPDVSDSGMIGVCSGVSADFRNIQVGEVVWLPGHIGVYIGDGLAVECTPSFAGGCQITAVGNIGTKAGYPTRKWTKHGKLSYVSYSAQSSATTATATGFKVGDVVHFVGGKHYPSATATAGNVVKAGNAKITAVSQIGTHKYHIVHTDNASTVYGWVDASTIASATQAKKKYKVNAQSGLNVRSGAGTGYSKLKALPNGSVIAISKQSNGWGYVPACGGWVCMQYVVAV